MYWLVRTQSDDGVALSAEVDFWNDETSANAGEPPIHTEDFIISRPRRTFETPKTDGGGQFLRADGTYVIPWVEVDGDWQRMPEDPNNPWVYETITLDMNAELTSVVEDYAARVL